MGMVQIYMLEMGGKLNGLNTTGARWNVLCLNQGGSGNMCKKSWVQCVFTAVTQFLYPSQAKN